MPTDKLTKSYATKPRATVRTEILESATDQEILEMPNKLRTNLTSSLNNEIANCTDLARVRKLCSLRVHIAQLVNNKMQNEKQEWESTCYKLRKLVIDKAKIPKSVVDLQLQLQEAKKQVKAKQKICNAKDAEIEELKNTIKELQEMNAELEERVAKLVDALNLT